MSEEDKIYLQIEEYLKGNLQGDSLSAFEQQIKESADLQRMVEASKLADELVIENRLREVGSILHETHIKSPGNGLWKSFTLLLVVAGAAGVFFLVNSAHSPEQKSVSQPTANPPAVTEIREPEKEPADFRSSGSEQPQVTKSPDIQKSNPTPAITGPAAIIPDDSLPVASAPSLAATRTDKAPETRQPPAPVVPKDPCATVVIETHVSTTPACEGEQSGAIILSEIQGGQPPYSREVLQLPGLTPRGMHDLGGGKYLVRITDRQGCIREYHDVSVKEKNCPKDYSFNPFIGEVWNIPSDESDGTLRIINHSGKPVIVRPVRAHSAESWNGYPEHGEIEPGYYIFTISYNDGRILQGSITVVR